MVCLGVLGLRVVFGPYYKICFHNIMRTGIPFSKRKKCAGTICRELFYHQVKKKKNVCLRKAVKGGDPCDAPSWDIVVT